MPQVTSSWSSSGRGIHTPVPPRRIIVPPTPDDTNFDDFDDLLDDLEDLGVLHTPLNSPRLRGEDPGEVTLHAPLA